MSATKTPVCDFNLKAPSFSLPDTTDTMHTLDGCMGDNGLLIMFICNHCPFVKAILNKIVHDTSELLEHGVNSVAIMSNDPDEYTEDSPSNMRKIAEKHHFSFPYLFDETQKVAKAYGAVCTPDFFGYNRNFKLQYRGRLDDSEMTLNKKNSERELFNAMKIIAETQKGPENQIQSIGCSIKWKKS